MPTESNCKLLTALFFFFARKERRKNIGFTVHHLPWNHGIVGHAKVVLYLMDISVANTAVQNPKMDIIWARLPSQIDHQMKLIQLARKLTSTGTGSTR